MHRNNGYESMIITSSANPDSESLCPTVKAVTDVKTGEIVQSVFHNQI